MKILLFLCRGHRSLSYLSPQQAEQPINLLKVWDAKEKYLSKFEKRKPKYNVGSKVRIRKEQKVFNRGYDVRWTDEVFVISKVLSHMPIPMYVLTSFDGSEELLGKFYEFELQKVSDDFEYRIRSVLKESRDGKRSFVSWVGFDDSYNSWIPSKNIRNL